jgi:glycosyltransferase involved in cell wall biosynthesis
MPFPLSDFACGRSDRRRLLVDPSRDIALRVVHVVESYAAGTLSSVNLLVNGLTRRGHDVLLVHGTRPETPANYRALLHPSVRILQLNFGREIEPLRDLRATRTLARLLSRERPDILHLHSAKAGFIGRTAAGWVAPLPTFYSPRGFAFQQPHISAGRRRLYRMLERLAVATSSAITVACSQDELAIAREFTREVECVDNAIELAALTRFVDLREARICQPATEKFTVVSLGRTDPIKRPALFEETARLLAHWAPGRFRFIWIGDGPFHFDMQGPVEHLGWLERSEALGVLATQADVLLQTSVSEGLPLAVLEAKALGIPAIVPDVTGNRCAVTPAVSGIVVVGARAEQFATALVELSVDRPRLEHLSRGARTEAHSRYSSERLLDQWLELYQRELRHQYASTAPR